MLVKLDRALINLEWSQRFVASTCKALPRPTSDHKPILLDTRSTPRRTECFRYEDYWLQNLELINITRNRLTRNTKQMAIVTNINHRLRMVRAATRAWQKEQRSYISLRKNTAHVLQFMDEVEEWRALTDLEFSFRIVCNRKNKQLLAQEASHWRRRAKIKWCTLGDENSKFFHTMATYRFRKNSIKVLHHNNSEYFQDTEKINIATTYFRELFLENRSWTPFLKLNMLYHAQNTELQHLADPFTWNEIEREITMTPPGRSPGPDGFTNEFYKFYKNELKDDLTTMFTELHGKKIQLRGVNMASITLLPKRDTPTGITDYRPISLQHSIPKLIAKVLDNRLQRKMDALVDTIQFGFIRERSIIENFATAVEMIQCAKKSSRPVIILKLDFHKAFDTVHWGAINEIMQVRGFPTSWIWWVQHLLSTSQAQLLINGKYGTKFDIQKGVRQGDPPSPYIFNLVVDVLQQMLKKAYVDDILQHPIQPGAPLPILQYADDTLLILQGSTQQAR